MDWTAFLNPAERQRLECIASELKALQRERGNLRNRAAVRRETADIRRNRAADDSQRVVIS